MEICNHLRCNDGNPESAFAVPALEESGDLWEVVAGCFQLDALPKNVVKALGKVLFTKLSVWTERGYSVLFWI